ncbi:MAG: hypothetical protein IKV20_04195 [Clostridia bacterium]|nr:hypothetical protein [Clostridia bacterium]
MSETLDEIKEIGTDSALPEDGDIITEAVGAKDETSANGDIPPNNLAASGETPEVPVVSEKSPEAPAHERTASEIIMEDLEELIAEFPELSDLRDASELSDPIRYGKLRDLGLSPKEAYLATSGRKRMIDTRAHLSGAMPKPLNTPSNISTYAVRCVRELFDGISDEEIISLYRRVNG